MQLCLITLAGNIHPAILKKKKCLKYTLCKEKPQSVTQLKTIYLLNI